MRPHVAGVQPVPEHLLRESLSFLEVPKSPITGTVFDNARVHKMVHISEFTADLIQNNKLKFDASERTHQADLPRLLQSRPGHGHF